MTKYKIKKNIIDSMYNHMIDKEMGGFLVVNKENTINEFIPCENKARNKQFFYKIGIADKIKVGFIFLSKIISGKFSNWIAVHSHVDSVFPSQTDLRGVSNGSLFMIVNVTDKTIMLYKMENGKAQIKILGLAS